MHVPDVTEQQDDIYVQDFWTAGRPLLAVDYLPFFSSCRGFDSHIYFYYLTVGWCKLMRVKTLKPVLKVPDFSA